MSKPRKSSKRAQRMAPSAPRAPGSARRTGLLLLGIFLLAALVRGVYVSEIRDLPEFEMPAVDAGYHDYWAWGLASGQWRPPGDRVDPQIGRAPYFRPPLYPYFLGSLYALFGRRYLAVRMVQVAISAGSCVLLFLLGGSVLGRRAGLVAALLMAGYWAFVYFATELREVVLLVFLHLAFLLAMLGLRARPSAGRALLCGALLGLAALGKPNVLLFVPIAVGWAVMVPGNRTRRTRALLGTWLALGTMLVVAPVTIRNALCGGDFVLISSNGGINLYIGNNPQSTGYSVDLPAEFPKFRDAFDYGEISEYVSRAAGRPLRPSAVSGWFARRAVDYMRAHPAVTFRRVLKKALMFWAGIEVLSERDLTAARGESRILRVLPGNFASTLALAAVGLFWCVAAARGTRGAAAGSARGSERAPDRAALVLIVLFVAVYCVSFLPFFVTARYRVAVIPFLLLFAAYGLVRLAADLRARSWRGAVPSIVAIVAVYAADGVNWFGYENDGAKAAFDRGLAFDRHGRLGLAAASYAEALARRPGHVEAHNNLGYVWARRGKLAAAARCYSAALALEPRHYRAHDNLGNALLALGRVAEAIAHYSESLRINPRHANGHSNLGVALGRCGEPDRALYHFSQALALRPDKTQIHMNIGAVLAAQGRVAEAAAHFSLVVAAQPGNIGARRNLAHALFDQSKYAEAAQHYAQVLRMAPADSGARDGLRKARKAALRR